MADLLSVLSVAIQAAFALLALVMVVDWQRHRDTGRGYLVVAVGSLAVVILLAPVLGEVGPFSQVVTDVTLAFFLLSGYGLVMFRDAFVPLRPTTRSAVTSAIVGVGLLALVAELPADLRSQRGALQSVALVAVLGTWALCVLEPSERLWLGSIDRPAVEGSRMRALSLGYAGLVVVILVSTLATFLTRAPEFVLVVDLVTLAIVSLLYVSFSPPTWLRRIWRQPEEDAFRKALHDLLTYSPDRVTQAQRAVVWAARLVGGAGALIIDADGAVLAFHGLSADEARRVAADIYVAEPAAERGTRPPGSRIVVPLNLEQGRCTMVIFVGPFTPLFGDDEVLRLRDFAGSITASLDRVALNARLAALEKAKTDFLNIASHELRGPMTVIKGYLTMLDGGAMGTLSPRAMSVLPLLIAKSDEVDAMIEQMIEAARLEDGRLALKRQPGDIVELTEMAIQWIRPMLNAHKLAVEKPPGPIPAIVDPDRFQIVVRNLLTNAIKYSAAGSTVTVIVDQRGGLATVAVTDEGSGISMADQARLFTRFGRIESTEHIAGTGLGLWLSREIARMHDGDLTVESEAGRGSTFTLQVPLSQ